MATITYHKLRFLLNGVEHRMRSPRPIEYEELSGMLYYVRRLIGYTLFPRWSMTRLFMAEVMESFKKQHILRHEMKKITNKVLSELDSLEIRHAMEFDKEFIDVMVNSMSGKALGKVNELRGDIGGALMRHGMKNYVLCSYPYTFLNLCYDNVFQYDKCMEQVMEKYQLDFSEVFSDLRGSNMYIIASKQLDTYLKVTGEDIPENMTYKDSGCLEKLNSISRILLNEKNLHDAFIEAYNEVPDEKKHLVNSAMSIWLDDGKDDDIAKVLSEKYKVKRNKK